MDLSSVSLGVRGRRWSFAHCEYIELSRQLRVAGELQRLESKPLDVLQQLLEHAPNVVTKDQLIGNAWGTAATDQSLATAVSKLRKAFGGERDSVMLNVTGVGYRIAVPVCSSFDPQLDSPTLKLGKGQPIPGCSEWLAVRRLSLGGSPMVWLAEQKNTHEARVFKFAVDGLRLRALQREVTLSRIFKRSFGLDTRFVSVANWNFEQAPYFMASRYQGVNLCEFAETEDFRHAGTADRIALAWQICDAVAAAHSLGVLHNDLKPTNILLERRPEPIRSNVASLPGAWQVCLADFGVASLNQPEMLEKLLITHHGEFAADGNASNAGPLGTAMYCAPELFSPGALPTTRADVYALGVLLYQTLTGDFLETPSPGWEARVDDPLLRQDIADAANVDPRKRLASAAELAIRLQTLPERRAEEDRRQRDLLANASARAAMERSRVRRPWIVSAVAALIAGLLLSLWFARRAAYQRDLARSSEATLAGVTDFLTVDFLGQSNSLAASPRSTPISQQTLFEAVDRALPSIDQRFRDTPEIAARLHSTFAATFDARTRYSQAAQQFSLAAQGFRRAEGPLSQNAIIADLRGINAGMRGMTATDLANGRAAFMTEENLIAKLPQKSAELQFWEAFTQSATLILGPTPQGAIAPVTAALSRAAATPGFSPKLLAAMRLRLCNLYLTLNDGGRSEKIARDLVGSATTLYGRDSAATFQPRMVLEEALFIQEKYPETLQQSKSDTAVFDRTLGPENQLALAARFIKAEAEDALGDSRSALQDDAMIRTIAIGIPSAEFMAANSLAAMAAIECRNGDVSSGNRHAQTLIEESKTGPAAQPLFTQVGTFTLAECELNSAENAGRKLNEAAVLKLDHLLATVQVPVILQYPGYAELPAEMKIDQARLAMLRQQPDIARTYTEQASFNQLTEPFYRRQLARLKALLDGSQETVSLHSHK